MEAFFIGKKGGEDLQAKPPFKIGTQKGSQGTELW